MSAELRNVRNFTAHLQGRDLETLNTSLAPT
jgi:hypothetical protein